MTILANINRLLSDLLTVRERANGELSDAECAAIAEHWSTLSPDDQDRLLESALRRRVLARVGRD